MLHRNVQICLYKFNLKTIALPEIWFKGVVIKLLNNQRVFWGMPCNKPIKLKSHFPFKCQVHLYLSGLL